MRRASFGLALAAALLCLMVGGAMAGSRCKPGQNGCSKCLSRTKCKTCKSGYWIKDGTCYKCPTGCTSCYNKNGKPRCTSCKSTAFQLWRWRCVKRQPSGECPSPYWDPNVPPYGWNDVYGKAADGSCVKCQPQGYHSPWCKACSADTPTKCTKCEDPLNHNPMYISAAGNCEFCTQLHDGCLACADTTGTCTACDTEHGYSPDGQGGCKWQN